MANHDLPQADWPAFFDEFNAHRKGVHVTMEAVGSTTGRHTLADSVPFDGITYDEAANAITISLGGDSPQKHTVTDATHLYHKTGAGVMSSEVTPDEFLEITTTSVPPITYLRFAEK